MIESKKSFVLQYALKGDRKATGYSILLLVLLQGLDPGDLRSDACMDVLLKAGGVTEFEEDLEMDEEGCKDESCEVRGQ